MALACLPLVDLMSGPPAASGRVGLTEAMAPIGRGMRMRTARPAGHAGFAPGSSMPLQRL